MSLDYAVEQLVRELMGRFALPEEQARYVAQWHLIRMAQAVAIATVGQMTAKSAALGRAEKAEAELASLADVVNLELRESGEFNTQAALGQDLRSFIRLLVDANRKTKDNSKWR